MAKVRDFSRWFRSEVRRYGIRDANALVRALGEIDIKEVVSVMEEMGEDLAKAVQEKIESQPFWWEPLKPKYLEWKKKHELDERMLIATGEYLKAIGIQEVKQTAQAVRVTVGVPDENHPKWEVNYNTLARFLEKGTSKSPPRPHWGPAFRSWMRRRKPYARRLLDVLQEHIEAQIAKQETAERQAKPVQTHARSRQTPPAPPSSEIGGRPRRHD